VLDLGFKSSALGFSRLLYTFPGAIELPSMIWTTNPFFIDAAERQ
jgi:hypothetical protein